MAQQTFDVVVIGGGPGGYVAAIRAAQLGLNTALVEREHLGGICLNWGCIPTKALLRSADVYRLMREAKNFGLGIDGTATFDLAAMVKRSRSVARRLSGGVKHLLKKNKVTVFDGRGRLNGAGKVVVTDGDGNATADLAAAHIILATGARARELPGLEADGKQVWTYKHALVSESLPKSLLVVGSGAIGIEFASFFNTFGTEVTVVEVVDRILPVEDPEISDMARKALEKQGIRFLTGAKVTKLDKGANSVTATVAANSASQQVTVERVLSAVGITANSEDLGLEDLGVTLDRGHVVVDGLLRTSVQGLYAIGDLVAPPWLAHKASHEGVICAEAIAGGQPHPLDPNRVPGCTYCHPQVASLGLTEPQAKERGHHIKVGHFPFVGNGKAVALGDTEGMVKTVFDARTGELLGAHMIGAEVTEMIQGYAVGQTLETTEAELMETVFPHPTLSEMMHESVLDAYGRAIHF